MYVDSFLSAAIAKITEKIDAAKDSVASGSIRSMEDYRFVTGKIHAYNEDIQLLRQLFADFFETRTIYSRRDEDGYGEQRSY